MATEVAAPVLRGYHLERSCVAIKMALRTLNAERKRGIPIVDVKVDVSVDQARSLYLIRFCVITQKDGQLFYQHAVDSSQVIGMSHADFVAYMQFLEERAVDRFSQRLVAMQMKKEGKETHVDHEEKMRQAAEAIIGLDLADPSYFRKTKVPEAPTRCEICDPDGDADDTWGICPHLQEKAHD